MKILLTLCLVASTFAGRNVVLKFPVKSLRDLSNGSKKIYTYRSTYPGAVKGVYDQITYIGSTQNDLCIVLGTKAGLQIPYCFWDSKPWDDINPKEEFIKRYIQQKDMLIDITGCAQLEEKPTEEFYRKSSIPNRPRLGSWVGFYRVESYYCSNITSTPIGKSSVTRFGNFFSFDQLQFDMKDPNIRSLSEVGDVYFIKEYR